MKKFLFSVLSSFRVLKMLNTFPLGLDSQDEERSTLDWEEVGYV
jgi:hypothetical protein